MRRPSIGAAALWFGTSYGGAIAGYLVVNAVASRMLLDGFASFVIATTAAMVLGQVGLVGVHRGGLREASRLAPDDDEGLAALRRAVRAVSTVTLPLAGLTGAIAAYLLLPGDDGRGRSAAAAVVGVLVWFSGQQKLWANYLRGFGQVRFAGLLEGRSGGALVAVCQAIALGGTWLLLPDPGLTAALGAMAAGFAGPVGLAWLLAFRRWRHVPVGVPTGGDVREVLVVNRHFTSSMLGGALNTHLELWLAGLVLTGLDASLFTAGNRLAALLPVFIMSLGVVFSPLVARLHGHDDRRLERLLRTAAALATVLTAVLWIPMLLAPGLLLETVFGATFREAAPVLVILTVGGVSNVVTGLCSVALTMSRHEAVVANVQWLALVPRLLLGVLLAAQLGAVGLAIGSAVVTAAQWGTLWYLAFRRTGLRTHPTLRPEPGLLRRVSA